MPDAFEHHALAVVFRGSTLGAIFRFDYDFEGNRVTLAEALDLSGIQIIEVVQQLTLFLFP